MYIFIANKSTTVSLSEHDTVKTHLLGVCVCAHLFERRLGKQTICFSEAK